jgi:hypothetical protein
MEWMNLSDKELSMHKFVKRLLPLAVSLGLSLVGIPQLASAQSYQNRPDHPGFVKMATDLAIVRPVMLATTVVGTALFIVTLPFSAPTKSIEYTGEKLVATPARYTFDRCLGCSYATYHPKKRKYYTHFSDNPEYTRHNNRFNARRSINNDTNRHR